MDINEAKILVQRMVKESEKRAPQGLGHDSFILGGMEVKLETILILSNLKFSDFDQDGNFDVDAMIKRKLKR